MKLQKIYGTDRMECMMEDTKTFGVLKYTFGQLTSGIQVIQCKMVRIQKSDDGFSRVVDKISLYPRFFWDILYKEATIDMPEVET